MSGRLIAVINPNTTAAMTRGVVTAASAVAGPHTDLVGITPTLGPATVETNADEVAGAAAVLEELLRAEAGPRVPDGYVIACFGDTGLAAAKEAARGPVVGMTQAALVTAALVAEHFCIITLPRRTLAMSQRVVRELGLEHRCAVRAVDEGVATVAEGSEHLLDLFVTQAREAISGNDAEAIILGCAGLADLVAPLREAVGVPVIEGVAAAVGQVEALLAQGLSTSRANTFAFAQAGSAHHRTNDERQQAGKSMSVLFTGVCLYDPAAPDTMSAPTDVLVSGTRIVNIGAEAAATYRTQVSENPSGAHRIIDGNGHHVLLSGLINGHFHSPANHLKGSLPSLPLEEFMLYESPADPALAPTPREAYLRTMLAAIEMLRTGTTSVQDDAFLMPYPTPEIIDAVMSAYADSGIRASVALDQPEIPEIEKLPFLGADASPALRRALTVPAPMDRIGLLDAYRHLVSTWHDTHNGRLTAAVSISAPQRVSEQYFGDLDELSRTHRMPLFAHMLETKVQRTLATEQPRFAGRSLVRYTADLGLLSDRMNVIHAVWTDDADLDLIAGAGAAIAHNPVSNLRLGSGVMPFRRVRERGIPTCLGVDEAICDDSVNMWGVVKMAGLIHNITGSPSHTWPAAAEVLDCLWSGGAAAMLRGDDLGKVREGYLADLTLLDLHTRAFTPFNDLAGQLVYCQDGSSVRLTMVAGEIVVEDGRIVTVDEDALLAEARELFARRRPQIAAARRESGSAAAQYRAMVQRAAATDVGLDRWVDA